MAGCLPEQRPLKLDPVELERTITDYNAACGREPTEFRSIGHRKAARGSDSFLILL